MRNRSFRRIQSVLSLLAPPLVLAASGWHVVASDFDQNMLLANAALLLFTLTLSSALYKRAQGKESSWFGARIASTEKESQDEEATLLSADSVMLLAILGFVATAVIQPQ